MKKSVLFAGSLLSIACAANAKEVYVIKDGKMVNCEFVPSADAVEEAYEVIESENSAGEPMVKVKNPAEPYKSAFLYLPDAIDLDETWNLEFDYYFEEGTELTAECNKRECWKFDLMADTMPVKGAVWKTDAGQKEYRIAHVSIDARQRDFYSYVDGKSVLDNHGLGKLRSVTKYVYSSPFIPAQVAERGDGNKVKAIFLAMFPEAGAEIVGYIKNLKFVSDGPKPFYADKMTCPAGEGTIYTSPMTTYVYATNAGDETVGEMIYEEGMESPNSMYGQQLFVSQSPDGFYNIVKNDRMYCDLGEQGEADFYDTEYGFLPYLTRYDTEELMRVDENGIICDAQLRIPFGCAAKKTISVAMRLGHNAGVSGEHTPYADYIDGSADVRFPVEYRFESGDAKTIKSKTEWKQFRPSYTKGGSDYVDSIPTMMSMVYGDVEIPEGDYQYITLRFMPNDVISFMFGDIRLTGDQRDWKTYAGDYKLAEDYQGNLIPVSPTEYCADHDDNWEPNEIKFDATYDAEKQTITINNAGFESAEFYINGDSLYASSTTNVVDVTNWPQTTYIVKVKTSKGSCEGEIIITDVDDIIAKGAISIYPNPASDVITVTNEGVKSVSVYTVAGTLVASSESNVVNVASLVNGVYVVKANTEAGVITGQIIKK